MIKVVDSGPAFPRQASYREPSEQPGMSLRDWFAGQALNGWLSTYGDTPANPAQHDYDGTALATLAANSYALADAMLAERAKTEGREP